MASRAAAGTAEEREKLAGGLSSQYHHRDDDDDLSKMRAPDELEIGDDPRDEEAFAARSDAQQQQQAKQEPPKTSMTAGIVWMAINTLSTVGIVFTNKNIFSDPQWKLCQLTFASFHFFVTFMTLYVLSRPSLAYFVPRRATVRDMIPLSVTMCLNVILPNLSLAFSSVTFYQIARILLTPTVAVMNFVLYRATLPRAAIVSLVPACLGVGMVSYYDSLPQADATIRTTSPLGVLFAFSGIFASSLYTVWIGSYHKKLNMSSMQLLFNQAPIASFMLLYVIPFVDTFPDWLHVPASRWFMILLVGDGERSKLVGDDDDDDNAFARLPSFPPADALCSSLARLPRSSTFRNSLSSPRRAPSRAPSSATSRRAPLSRSAGWCLAAPLATSRFSAS
jgi:solute carrier family 35 protein E3